MGILLDGSPWVIISADSVIEHGSVYLEADTVLEVGPAADIRARHPNSEAIDCSDMVLAPGFINAHNHVYQVLCRGLGKDAGTEKWLLDLIYPVTRCLDEEDHYYGGLLGAAECLRSGTTSVVSQLTNFTRFHADSEMRAFDDAGIRACVARAASTASTIDPAENGTPDIELRDIEAFLTRWEDSDLVQPGVGPSGLFTCDPATLQALKALAKAKGRKFFIHLGETREQLELAHAHGYSGQVEWAYRLGLLDADTVVAHAVWINEGEIALLRETGATVVHNASSNLIMASGIANLPQLIRGGVHVSIATDGPASNDSQDMITEMRIAAMVHRGNTLNPTITDAPMIFRMATENGARTFGLEGELGRLEPGYRADVIGIRFAGNPCLQPIFDPLAALVYYGSGRDVALTIVNGKIVYSAGMFTTIDIDAVLRYVNDIIVPKVRRASASTTVDPP